MATKEKSQQYSRSFLHKTSTVASNNGNISALVIAVARELL
jgi:hypothetical protein